MKKPRVFILKIELKLLDPVGALHFQFHVCEGLFYFLSIRIESTLCQYIYFSLNACSRLIQLKIVKAGKRNFYRMENNNAIANQLEEVLEIARQIESLSQTETQGRQESQKGSYKTNSEPKGLC